MPFRTLFLSSLLFWTLACQSQNEAVQSAALRAPDVLIVGHRGYAGAYPENSLPGIERALALGLDRIEIDVHQTRDGQVVLMHDATLQRTTNGRGKVADYNWSDLQRYQLDFPDSLRTTDRYIPSLDEVLTRFQDQSATLLIEVKKGGAHYPQIEENILQLLAQHQLTQGVILQSFDDAVLRRFHELDSSLVLHKLLLSSWGYDFTELDFVAEFSINYYFATAALIEDLAKRQQKLNVWTVNTEAQMKKAIALGVNGIITDQPERLRALLAR